MIIPQCSSGLKSSLQIKTSSSLLHDNVFIVGKLLFQPRSFSRIIHWKSLVEVYKGYHTIFIFQNSNSFRISTVGYINFLIVHDSSNSTCSDSSDFSVIKCEQGFKNVLKKILVEFIVGTNKCIGYQLIRIINILFIIFILL